MSLGKTIIDEIIKGKMFKATCSKNKDHGCLVVWSSQAEEQLEAIISNHKEGD